MNNNDDIFLSDFSNKNIGKFFGKSKIEYNWIIKINENNFHIKLHHSIYSKKFRVHINDKLKVEETFVSNKLFEKKIKILDKEFLILQTFNGFDLLYKNKNILNYKIKHSSSKNFSKTPNLPFKKILKINKNIKKFEYDEEFLTLNYKNYASVIENNYNNYNYLY